MNASEAILSNDVLDDLMGLASADHEINTFKDPSNAHTSSIFLEELISKSTLNADKEKHVGNGITI